MKHIMSSDASLMMTEQERARGRSSSKSGEAWYSMTATQSPRAAIYSAASHEHRAQNPMNDSLTPFIPLSFLSMLHGTDWAFYNAFILEDGRAGGSVGGHKHIPGSLDIPANLKKGEHWVHTYLLEVCLKLSKTNRIIRGWRTEMRKQHNCRAPHNWGNMSKAEVDIDWKQSVA